MSEYDNEEVAEALSDLARETGRIASAIYPPNTMRGQDATGGTIGSLTEACMGITAGLVQVAEALSSVADAIRERSEP